MNELEFLRSEEVTDNKPDLRDYINNILNDRYSQKGYAANMYFTHPSYQTYIYNHLKELYSLDDADTKKALLLFNYTNRQYYQNYYKQRKAHLQTTRTILDIIKILFK